MSLWTQQASKYHSWTGCLFSEPFFSGWRKKKTGKGSFLPLSDSNLEFIFTVVWDILYESWCPDKSFCVVRKRKSNYNGLNVFCFTKRNDNKWLFVKLILKLILKLHLNIRAFTYTFTYLNWAQQDESSVWQRGVRGVNNEGSSLNA